MEISEKYHINKTILYHEWFQETILSRLGIWNQSRN